MVTQATFRVWRFSTPDGARRSSYAVGRSERIVVHDGAIVAWPFEDSRPQAYQDLEMGFQPLGAPFWGLLFGVLFVLPNGSTGLAGRNPSVSSGAAGEAVMALLGFDEHFCQKIRAEIVPGTSALLLLEASSDPAAVARLLPQAAVEIVRSDVSVEQVVRLHAAFGNPH